MIDEIEETMKDTFGIFIKRDSDIGKRGIKS